MAKRSKRHTKQKASGRKLANIMAAPRPEPDNAYLAAASRNGNAVMAWFNGGDAYYPAPTIVEGA